MLEGLVTHYQDLCQSSIDLATFLEGKTFVAELVIFSGQMDLKVASLENGAIIWHTNLEKI